jgi:hypothetical protein
MVHWAKSSEQLTDGSVCVNYVTKFKKIDKNKQAEPHKVEEQLADSHPFLFKPKS